MTTKITALAQGRRFPIPFIDDEGIPCLRVPLDNQGKTFAMIERKDYDHIVQNLGCCAAWCLTGNGSGRRYVVVNPPRTPDRKHGLISVARLFTGASAGKFVRYASRDTMDLRRSNLIVTSGTGRSQHDCGKWLTEAVQGSSNSPPSS